MSSCSPTSLLYVQSRYSRTYMAFQTLYVISSGVSQTWKSLEVCFQDFVPCDIQDDDSSVCQGAHNSHLLIERRNWVLGDSRLCLDGTLSPPLRSQALRPGFICLSPMWHWRHIGENQFSFMYTNNKAIETIVSIGWLEDMRISPNVPAMNGYQD